MTLPSLPAQGSTSWYAYAQGLDTAARGAAVIADVGTTGTATGDALSGTYGPQLRGGIYNLKAHQLLRIRSALAKARTGTGYAKIATLGDSTVGGVGATNIPTRSWPEQMVAHLGLRGYSSSGSGLVVPFKDAAADPRWTSLTGWSDFGRSSFLVTGSSSPAVFTSTNTGTAVDVHYSSAHGPFSVAIDGGAATTVTPSGADGTAVYTVTGLPNTTHTVQIVRTTATNAILFGVAVRSASSGIYLLNGGIGGSASSDIAGSHWSTVVGFATSQFAADLVVICCEVNDVGLGTTPATQKTNLQAAITTAQSGGASVLLMTGAPFGTADLTAYTAKHYELAVGNDLPLVDIQARWNASESANAALGLMTGDAIHPTDAGYADIGVAVAELILAP